MTNKLYDVVIDPRTGETIEIREIEGSITDPEALMQQILHDCPECRAALERGEKPQAFEVLPTARPGRWRTRKQRR